MMVTTSKEAEASTILDNQVCSALISDNIIGLQFHPEKSQRHGDMLLQKIMENSDETINGTSSGC